MMVISMSKILSPSILSMKVRFGPADGVKNINWSTSFAWFPYNLSAVYLENKVKLVGQGKRQCNKQNLLWNC